uniref:Uncharacterized protein n=1 Tax=Magnetococcus massalia (strain MO-1) TaxID=451514 RepID=A0A1S7LEG0_MAGMO|nr:Conserved protein of unknown function [Candidatus Magnetococcus massalia]
MVTTQQRTWLSTSHSRIHMGADQWLRIESFQRLMVLMGRWYNPAEALQGEQQQLKQRVYDLRSELALLKHLGMYLPEVANREQAVYGEADQFTTFADALELITDTVLGRVASYRGGRYKSNDFTEYLDLTLKAQQHPVPLDPYEALKTLNLRARQLGCVLTAMVSMLHTPRTWRWLFANAFYEDQWARYPHLYDQLHKGSSWLPGFLKRLGISGTFLLNQFMQDRHPDRFMGDKACRHFLNQIHHTGLDDRDFQQRLQSVRQDCCHHHEAACREFSLDDHGHWCEKIQGGSEENAWVAWLPFEKKSGLDEPFIGRYHDFTPEKG